VATFGNRLMSAGIFRVAGTGNFSHSTVDYYSDSYHCARYLPNMVAAVGRPVPPTCRHDRLFGLTRAPHPVTVANTIAQQSGTVTFNFPLDVSGPVEPQTGRQLGLTAAPPLGAAFVSSYVQN
jgi:hypothetical protein